MLNYLYSPVICYLGNKEASTVSVVTVNCNLLRR